MKERPILFSAPMVRALLAGTKTQTRRVLKQAKGPSLSVGIPDETPGEAELSWLYGDGPGYDVHESIKLVPCPYGQPGDRLWVREAWRAVWSSDNEPPRSFDSSYRFWYEADAPLEDGYGKLRPSIHMPRIASRITLEVTGVRVERLRDISEADAMAEGAPWAACCAPQEGSHKAGFAALWESINGPGSWDANPWVWVVSFNTEGQRP